MPTSLSYDMVLNKTQEKQLYFNLLQFIIIFFIIRRHAGLYFPVFYINRGAG